jgi:DNA modification methylase
VTVARLCFTSPPYGNQRDYTSGGISDWDGLMRGVFAHLPMAGDGQVLVNLGLIHRDNEVIPYWDAWLSWMRQQGWRRFAWYVWDQGPGMPGDWAGRFAPSFEFVFHFNRESRKPNKIVPCKHAGQESHLRADGSSTAMRGKDGEVGGWTHKGQPTQDTRIPDSVIRVMRHKGKIGQDIDHPAVFPVALPEFVIEAYTDAGDIVFEPFGGSGTTMLAAERTGRICRSVEIAPEYVDVAIKRFQQNHPGVPVTLIPTGQSFEQVAAERPPPWMPRWWHELAGRQDRTVADRQAAALRPQRAHPFRGAGGADRRQHRRVRIHQSDPGRQRRHHRRWPRSARCRPEAGLESCRWSCSTT